MPCQLLLARNLTRPPAFYRLMLYQLREALLEALGIVTVDKTFTDGIGAKLFAKYGAATDGAPDNLDWDLIEPVRYTDGKVYPFKTNWAAAIVSSSDADGVTLNLKMLDFRVCWANSVRRNERPRNQASGLIKF